MKLPGFNARIKLGVRNVLDVDGIKCFDMGMVADAFNRTFTNVARSLVS